MLGVGVGRPAASPALCDLIERYAALLAANGQLRVALEYLNLIPGALSSQLCVLVGAFLSLKDWRTGCAPAAVIYNADLLVCSALQPVTAHPHRHVWHPTWIAQASRPPAWRCSRTACTAPPPVPRSCRPTRCRRPSPSPPVRRCGRALGWLQAGLAAGGWAALGGRACWAHRLQSLPLGCWAAEAALLGGCGALPRWPHALVATRPDHAGVLPVPPWLAVEVSASYQQPAAAAYGQQQQTAGYGQPQQAAGYGQQASAYGQQQQQAYPSYGGGYGAPAAQPAAQNGYGAASSAYGAAAAAPVPPQTYGAAAGGYGAAAQQAHAAPQQPQTFQTYGGGYGQQQQQQQQQQAPTPYQPATYGRLPSPASTPTAAAAAPPPQQPAVFQPAAAPPVAAPPTAYAPAAPPQTFAPTAGPPVAPPPTAPVAPQAPAPPTVYQQAPAPQQPPTVYQQAPGGMAGAGAGAGMYQPGAAPGHVSAMSAGSGALPSPTFVPQHYTHPTAASAPAPPRSEPAARDAPFWCRAAAWAAPTLGC